MDRDDLAEQIIFLGGIVDSFNESSEMMSGVDGEIYAKINKRIDLIGAELNG